MVSQELHNGMKGLTNPDSNHLKRAIMNQYQTILNYLNNRITKTTTKYFISKL